MINHQQTIGFFHSIWPPNPLFHSAPRGGRGLVLCGFSRVARWLKVPRNCRGIWPKPMTEAWFLTRSTKAIWTRTGTAGTHRDSWYQLGPGEHGASMLLCWAMLVSLPTCHPCPGGPWDFGAEQPPAGLQFVDVRSSAVMIAPVMISNSRG